MMILSSRLLLRSGLAAAVAALLAAPAITCAETAPATVAKPAAAPAAVPDRSQAYYHTGLAAIRMAEATAEGRMDRLNQAIDEYKLAIAADPNSPELATSLATIYFHAGRLKEAETAARAVIKLYPDNVEAHKLLGKVYLRQLSEGHGGNTSGSSATATLDAAIAEYQKLIPLDPKSVENHMLLGQLFSAKGQGKKAEAEFEAARAIEPSSEEVVLNLARLYAENADAASQIKLIESIPAADRSSRMEAVLGNAYEQDKKLKEAIAAYRRAIELEPDDTRLVEALGQALSQDEQFDEALKAFHHLAELDPDNFNALIRQGELLRRMGRYDEALKTVREARKKDPKSLDAGYNEGLLLDVLGHYDEAAKVLEDMVDQTSHANGAYTAEEKANRAIFLERLASVYKEQNKSTEAAATYGKMVELGGDTARRGYQGQVDVWSDAKNFDKSIEAARKASDAFPKDREMKLLLSGELVDHGQVDEGLAMARSLLNGSADDRPTLLAIGQMCVRLRRYKEAEDAFNKATPLSTKKEEQGYLFFLRGELAERQKHFDVAEAEFRRMLDIDPTNTMTLNYLGYMLADKTTRYQDALKLIRKAVELDPLNGAYLDSLGWVYFKMGDYELAEENLRQAIERDQSDPTVHEHMGELYEKTGRIRLAAAQWEAAIAGFNRSAPADVEPGEVAKLQRKLEAAKARMAKQDSATNKGRTE